MDEPVLETVAESDYSAEADDANFAYVPDGGAPSDRKIKIGDAVHAHEAVVAVANGKYRGNKLDIPTSAMGKVKARVAAAVRKFYSGAEQKRLLKWLETGSDPGKDEDTSEMTVAEIQLATPAFAFKGKFPDVPLAPGVDYEALTAGDPSPLFVVRPLAVEGAVSDNGLKYDLDLLHEIQDQVILKRPCARQGHVSEEAKDYAFPPDVGLWVGATIVGNTLYGKAYIYGNTPFHQMVVKRKAAGSTLSNSIWGKGHFEPNGDGTQRLRGLELESIDFAPAERAALEALGGQFDTTSEMGQGGNDMADKNPDEAADLELIRKEIARLMPSKLHEFATKEQRAHIAESCLREMEPSAVYGMLPQGHRQHIAECYTKEFGQKMGAAEMTQVTEMQTQLTEMQTQIDQYKAMATSVSEMKAQIAEYQRQDYERALDNAAGEPFATWNANKPEAKTAIASARNNFKLFVVAEMATMDGGAKVENIAAAAAAAWPKYEPQAALLKVALSGGNTVSGLVSEQTRTPALGYDPTTKRYTDDAAKRERQRMGL